MATLRKVDTYRTPIVVKDPETQKPVMREDDPNKPLYVLDSKGLPKMRIGHIYAWVDYTEEELDMFKDAQSQGDKDRYDESPGGVPLYLSPRNLGQECELEVYTKEDGTLGVSAHNAELDSLDDQLMEFADEPEIRAHVNTKKMALLDRPMLTSIKILEKELALKEAAKSQNSTPSVKPQGGKKSAKPETKLDGTE